MLTHDELITLLRNLRKAQKKFFKDRDYDALHEAKTLEKQIDKLIEEDEKGPDLFQ